jgi:eukaryotic-like serine/threonine-protein kinase
MPLRSHSRVGPYEIVGLLGTGGMGEVYRARDPRLGRDVAIKVLPDHASSDPARRRRFEQEARAASALNHPNICTIHEIGEHEGAPYIVMELLDGVPLRERLRTGPVPLPVLLHLAMQAADALEAAHGAGIVHRDLTPSNIFVTPRGDAKILDFGLAKLTADVDSAGNSRASTVAAETPLTGQGRMIGTPGYASPEQTLGLPADSRSDLFALGVVLYEMATGHRAFSGESPAMAGDAVVHAAPPPVSRLNPQVPAGLSAIIDKALEKDPALRYQTAAEVKADLRRLERNAAGGTPVPSDHPVLRNLTPAQFGTPLPTAEPPRPAWRRWAGWAVLVFACLGVTAGLYLWGRSAPTSARLPESVTREVTTGPYADVEPAVSPDGHTIAYVVDDGVQQSIWMVETRGGLGTPWTKRPGRHRHPSWAPDGRIFFESGENDQRGIYVAPGFDSERAMLVVPGGREPAISWDGKKLAFVSTNASGYQRINVTSVDDWSNIAALTTDRDGRWDHVNPAWSSDGRWICYRANDGLWLVPSDRSGNPVRLTKGTVDAHPAWSVSGFVYFSSLREGIWQLWRVRPNELPPERVTSGIGVEQMPSLSRDGRVLAFSTADDRADVFIRDLKSGVERPVGGGSQKLFPAFAPDGRSLYLLLNAWNRRSLWVQPIADGGPSGPMRPLLADAVPQSGVAVHSQPAASPDGRWVAFLEIKGDSREIFVVPAAGGAPVNVTNHPDADYLPAWSPDSSRLAFVSERDGGPRIWVQAIDGGRPRGEAQRLTTGALVEQFPAWSPDGTRVVFVSGTAGATEVAVADARRRAAPVIVATGSHPERVRWVARQGWLLICGTWASDRYSVRAYDLARREYVPAFTEVPLGSTASSRAFDVSPDGRYLAIVRAGSTGRIGVLETRAGVY